MRQSTPNASLGGGFDGSLIVKRATDGRTRYICTHARHFGFRLLLVPASLGRARLDVRFAIGPPKAFLAPSHVTGHVGNENLRHHGISPERGPPVYLNHLLIVLDKRSYADVGNSEFLKQKFAGFSQVAVRAEREKTWSGTYLTGQRTYLEFFEPNAAQRVEEGDYGIGLGIEEAGGLEAISAQLRSKTRGRVKKRLRKRRINDREIPWFRHVKISYSRRSDTPNIWVMEYLRSYMDTREPNVRPASRTQEITRARYNARKFSADRYLNDIVGVTVAVNRRQSTRFASELRALGYEVRLSGTKWVCEGPDITFTIVAENPSSRGVTEIRMSLLRSTRRRITHRFGPRSSLTLAGKTAVWRF